MHTIGNVPKALESSSVLRRLMLGNFLYGLVATRFKSSSVWPGIPGRTDPPQRPRYFRNFLIELTKGFDSI